MRRLSIPGLAVLMVASSAPPPAEACAPAPPEGELVGIAGEEALIVWDAETRTQEFIRRADFHTDADDFGFLVPTPAPPTLREIDDGVFRELHRLGEPVVEPRTTYVPVPCILSPWLLLWTGAVEGTAPTQGVEVLSTARVAGMDATVLRADDPDALAAWLDGRGFALRPALRDWLRPYVEDGFAITAFRYTKDQGSASQSLGSRAVRMTFQADAPYYPYREPSDIGEEMSRRLVVHVLGRGRAEGHLAEAGFGADVVVARPLPEAASLPDALRLPEDAWLTTFVDRSRVRPPGADLTFTLDPAGAVHRPTYRPRSIVPVPFPIELVVLGFGVWWWVRRRRRRAA
jgi:hypothetical protein